MIEHGNTSHNNTKNMLPEVNKKVSLRKYGYRLNKRSTKRKQSLNRASKKYSTLSVLRRVNLIRNYSKKNKKKYETLTNDVDYLKDKYATEKEKNIKTRKNTRIKKK